MLNDLYNFFYRKAYKKNFLYIKRLVDLAFSDGYIEKKELEYIKEICKRRNISKNDLDKIIKGAKVAIVEIPIENNQKFLQLFDLISLMVQDGIIHQREMNLCRDWVQRCEFNLKHSDQLIDSIIHNINNGHDSEETFKRISWMINNDSKTTKAKISKMI